MQIRLPISTLSDRSKQWVLDDGENRYPLDLAGEGTFGVPRTTSARPDRVLHRKLIDGLMGLVIQGTLPMPSGSPVLGIQPVKECHFEDMYRKSLSPLPHKMLVRILRAWLRTCHPNRETRWPYNRHDRKPISHLIPNKSPDYWPDRIPYQNPDTLRRAGKYESLIPTYTYCKRF